MKSLKGQIASSTVNFDTIARDYIDHWKYFRQLPYKLSLLIAGIKSLLNV